MDRAERAMRLDDKVIEAGVAALETTTGLSRVERVHAIFKAMTDAEIASGDGPPPIDFQTWDLALIFAASLERLSEIRAEELETGKRDDLAVCWTALASHSALSYWLRLGGLR